MEDDILSFFRETQEAFTVYVVEQRFVVGRGLDYFKSFKGKPNYIDSNTAIRRRISKILRWIGKNIPAASDLIAAGLSLGPKYDIVDAITLLNKIFSVHTHQAAGPEVIDPIIIQEGNIEVKYITQIVTLHEKSILQPVIILLLKDNDFERAKDMLSNCPHGINIKMIRNSGESEICKVINTGAENISSFMDAYAQQCFSTCSHTPRQILLNKKWSENLIISAYAPSLLKIRSSLIMDEKEDVRSDLLCTLGELERNSRGTSQDEKLLLFFRCIANLMLVFCNDAGNQEIQSAYSLAKESGNALLQAQVYRYAYFLPQYTKEKQIALLRSAEETFSREGMEDQSLYCKNNRLTYQFEQNKLHISEFQQLQEEAIYNVPGLVGMSHILNNTGVAYLMGGNPEEAIVYFKRGMDYARRQERNVQRLAIICNELIARSYCFIGIDANQLRNILNQIFDSMGFCQLPFISARFAMNIVAIAFKQSRGLGKEFLHDFPIKALVQSAFASNLMGSGLLLLQMQYLAAQYSEFDLLTQISIPPHPSESTGLHREFILRHGYNPFIFCTWL